MKIKNIAGNIRLTILTTLLFFIIPIGMAYWYIQKITIKEFSRITVATFAGVTSNFESSVIDTGSFGPNYNYKTNQRFEDISQAITDLSFFNITPGLIKHSLFLDNSSVGARVTYARVDPNGQLTGILESTLACDGRLIEARKENNGRYLVKSHLDLNESSSKTDKQYIDEIIRTCVVGPTIGLKNNFGYSVEIHKNSIEILEGSGIWLIIEPDSISKTIIYYSFFVFWTGSLLLVWDGPVRFYCWAIKKKEFK